LICVSGLTGSTSLPSFRFARGGTLMRIRAAACAEVSRISRSASSETGSWIRSSVSLSSSAIRTEPHTRPATTRKIESVTLTRLHMVFFRRLIAEHSPGLMTAAISSFIRLRPAGVILGVCIPPFLPNGQSPGALST
jgi:hypothetical protein